MTPFLEQIRHVVSGGMMSWYETKMFIEHASVVSSDALHVVVGVLVWMLVAVLWRKPLTARGPLAILIGLIIFNEMVDLWAEQWPDKAMQLGESAKDVVLTLLLPVVLMLAVRLRPELFRSSPRGHRR